MDDGIIFESMKTPDFSILELLSPPCLDPPSPPCLEPPSPPCLDPPSPLSATLTRSDCLVPEGGVVGAATPRVCDRSSLDSCSQPVPGAHGEGSGSSYQVPEFAILCLLQEAAKLVPALKPSKPSYHYSPTASGNHSSSTLTPSDSSPISPLPQCLHTGYSTRLSGWEGQSPQSEEGTGRLRQELYPITEDQGQGDSLPIDEQSGRNCVPVPDDWNESAEGRYLCDPGKTSAPGWDDGLSETGRASVSPKRGVRVKSLSCGTGSSEHAEVTGRWAGEPGTNAGVRSWVTNEGSCSEVGLRADGDSKECTAGVTTSSAPESRDYCRSGTSDSCSGTLQQTRKPRKQPTPHRSAFYGDPSFEGVTLCMERRIVSATDCQLHITAHYSPGLHRKLLKIRSRRKKPDPLARFSSSEEDSPNAVYGKSCVSCGTGKTPLWRDAEDGTPLCNACGIRYKKYRIRCSNCWHIPKKEGLAFVRCLRCGDPLRAPITQRRACMH
ncbi:GATA-type zinc finger protein 1 [Rhincodon typus]|uniref:GATA-type zinc finger protein 1 n=1 Tax=Rhincodon typus TaxID=259920 RepID=UPI002030AEEF|nr:GATA-type zinc finger protein 1 [Rhincodon typus]